MANLPILDILLNLLDETCECDRAEALQADRPVKHKDDCEIAAIIEQVRAEAAQAITYVWHDLATEKPPRRGECIVNGGTANGRPIAVAAWWFPETGDWGPDMPKYLADAITHWTELPAPPVSR